MTGTARKKSDLPINPRMLRWARERAGRSVEEAATRSRVKVAQVTAWEDEHDSSVPTVRQARILAKFYDRSFLEFFRGEPPELPDPDLIPDFRLYRSADDPSQTRKLKNIQLWVEAQRTNALDLYSELGETPPTVPESLFATLAFDEEDAAARARVALKFSLEEQVGLKASERYQLPSILRRKIEATGILTLRRADLKAVRVRGFCIATYPLPVIVFGNESPAAQAFTLVHEFAHVLIKQSAISGPLPRVGGGKNERKIEEWCNQFAAAFLLPRDAVENRLARPDVPAEGIPDETLSELAQRFCVSEHAMLIRLVELRYVRASYYWNVKRPQFDKEEENYSGFGRASYYGTRYRSSLGDLYTSLVIGAWSNGRITNHNAAEYMGIKNLAHLRDVRENFETQ